MSLLENDNIGDEVALQLEKETPVLESTSRALIWIPFNVQSRPNKQGCDSPDCFTGLKCSFTCTENKGEPCKTVKDHVLREGCDFIAAVLTFHIANCKLSGKFDAGQQPFRQTEISYNKGM